MKDIHSVTFSLTPLSVEYGKYNSSCIITKDFNPSQEYNS